MADNYLPSEEQVTLLNSELFFKPDGAARPQSMGYVDSFTWTPEIERATKTNSNSGVQKDIAEIIRSIKVNIALKLAETSARNMAIALQGDLGNVVQTAKTAEVITETDVKPGEIIKLGAYDVTEVSVTDGTDPLELGSDYTLDAAAGIITVRGDEARATVEVTFSAPEITEADGKKIINVLSQQDGIKGVFTVRGTNKTGTRYLFDGIRASLTPSGEVAFINEDGDFQSIELEGSGLENGAAPLTPWGTLVPLN